MRFLVIYFCLVLGGHTALAEPRVWAMANGKTVEAEFVSLIGGNVSLKSSKGKLHKIPEDQFSAEDLNYIQLQMPPQLDLSFSKSSKQRIFPDSLSDLPRSLYFDFVAKINQTSTRQYDQELVAELFCIGKEIYGGKGILVAYQKSSFFLSEGSKSTFELSSNTVELIDMIIGDQHRGTKFKGYLIVITDPRGEVIAYKTSTEDFFRNLENLRKVPVGKTFDEDCNRCMPTRPKRYY